MSKLMVITVPPEFTRNGAHEVILGDCILPGHVLGTYPTASEADDACERFAAHYELRAHTLRAAEVWSRRAEMRLIKGGRK